MPNNKNESKKSTSCKEVIFIKLLIIFVILLVPIVYMLLSTSEKFLVYNNQGDSDVLIEDSKKQEIQKADKDDFEIGIPAESTGDLSNVAPEKIDSLFDNLK